MVKEYCRGVARIDSIEDVSDGLIIVKGSRQTGGTAIECMFSATFPKIVVTRPSVKSKTNPVQDSVSAYEPPVKMKKKVEQSAEACDSYRIWHINSILFIFK